MEEWPYYGVRKESTRGTVVVSMEQPSETMELLAGIPLADFVASRVYEALQQPASTMRRFILTYIGEGLSESIDIEGIVFTSGIAVLELYPDNDWPGTRTFRSVEHLLFTLREFGDPQIRWLDPDVAASGH